MSTAARQRPVPTGGSLYDIAQGLLASFNAEEVGRLCVAIRRIEDEARRDALWTQDKAQCDAILVRAETARILLAYLEMGVRS